MTTRPIPWSARVQLGHAAIQRLAEATDTDVLHVKGFALDDALIWPGREGSDADVLVRPAHLRRFVAELHKAEWERAIGFDQGSSFGHSLALRHDNWGNADVHRFFPGLGPDPAASFDVLWRDRRVHEIAGVPCPVPNLAGQALILILHAGRTHDDARADSDLQSAWTDAEEGLRADVQRLVTELGAEVGFAAATGQLERYRDRPDYLLWKVASQGGTRFEEWRGRIRAAGSPQAALRLALRAPLVNVEHLSEVLGRRPTFAEIVAEFFRRPVKAILEQVGLWRSGRR